MAYWLLIRRNTRQLGMTAQEFPGYQLHRISRSLLLPFVLLVLLVAGAGTFVSYELWPTWPSAPIPLQAPSIPITVAGVLFNVPPTAIRKTVQRYPGAHQRLDLVFLWPSLAPPGAQRQAAAKAAVADLRDAPPMPGIDDRLFVTVAGLGAELPPAARLRDIYPRYIEVQATAGAYGLAMVAFRRGTPYEGEDLVYLADAPERFVALCSRAAGTLPGTCIHERMLDTAELTLRFPRQWLQDWRKVAAGFDRLMLKLRAPAADG